MRLSSAIRAMLIAWTLTVGFGTAAYADGGRIRFNVVKAGFVIGASGGSGTLLFHGRYYPLAIGGLSYGFTFGASVYVAAGAGAAVGPGGGAILLTNQNGALLTVSGRQVGLIVAADLNGLVITVR